MALTARFARGEMTMSDYVVWFVLGLALLGAELMTGTFYLLIVAAAFGAAGAVALAGSHVAIQFAVAIVAGVGGALWLRRWRASRPSHKDPAVPLQHMDVGQSVRIEQWSENRTTRAHYRGALWDVELAAGEEPKAGEFVIREIQANRLVVATRKAG